MKARIEAVVDEVVKRRLEVLAEEHGLSMTKVIEAGIKLFGEKQPKLNPDPVKRLTSELFGTYCQYISKTGEKREAIDSLWVRFCDEVEAL